MIYVDTMRCISLYIPLRDTDLMYVAVYYAMCVSVYYAMCVAVYYAMCVAV